MDGQELTFPRSQVRHNGLRRPSGFCPAKDWPHLLCSSQNSTRCHIGKWDRFAKISGEVLVEVTNNNAGLVALRQPTVLSFLADIITPCNPREVSDWVPH